VIAGLLATVAGLEWLGPRNVPSEIAMLSLAMGMMNPALSAMVGAALSGMAHSHFRFWALLPPCVFMIALALFSESATPAPKTRITPSMRGLEHSVV
jgi:hypothetical protein